MLKRLVGPLFLAEDSTFFGGQVSGSGAVIVLTQCSLTHCHWLKYQIVTRQNQSSRVSLIQSMLGSIRSSRMIRVSSALFSQPWYWLSFIVGYIRKGVNSHIANRRSAFIEPTSQSQDEHQSVRRE
eukprot:1273003-Amphidinium_carterae.8